MSRYDDKEFSEFLKKAWDMPPEKIGRLIVYLDGILVREYRREPSSKNTRSALDIAYDSMQNILGECPEKAGTQLSGIKTTILYAIENKLPLSNDEIGKILKIKGSYVAQIKYLLKKGGLISGKGQSAEVTEKGRNLFRENEIKYTSFIEEMDAYSEAAVAKETKAEEGQKQNDLKKLGILSGIEANISNEDISKILGISPSHASTLRSDYREEGLISGKGKNIKLRKSGEEVLKNFKEKYPEKSKEYESKAGKGQKQSELNESDIAVLYAIGKGLSASETKRPLNVEKSSIIKIKKKLREKLLISGKGKNTKLEQSGADILKENETNYSDLFRNIDSYAMKLWAERQNRKPIKQEKTYKKDILMFGLLMGVEKGLDKIPKLLGITKSYMSYVKANCKKEGLISGRGDSSKLTDTGEKILEELKTKYVDKFQEYERKIKDVSGGATLPIPDISEKKTIIPDVMKDEKAIEKQEPPISSVKEEINLPTLPKRHEPIKPEITGKQKPDFDYILEDKNIRITNGKEYIKLLLIKSEQLDKKGMSYSGFDPEFVMLEIIKNAEPKVKKEELGLYLDRKKNEWLKNALGVMEEERNLVESSDGILKIYNVCGRMLEQGEGGFFGKRLSTLRGYGLMKENIFYHDGVGKISMPPAIAILDEIKNYERNAIDSLKNIYNANPTEPASEVELKIFDTRVELIKGDKRKVLVTNRSLTDAGKRYLPALTNKEGIGLDIENEFLKYELIDKNKNLMERGTDLKSILEKFAVQQTTN